MRTVLVTLLLAVSCVSAVAQQSTTASNEKPVPLNSVAIALDGIGSPALEGTLKTTALHGADDSPVTNIRVVVRNASTVDFAFVSGLITFYDGSGVRCGEGIFKADALAVNEAFETDTPGIRIRCSPVNWRIVATNLLPRVAPLIAPPLSATTSRANTNFVISIDGEEHPIQLDKPMVLNFGSAERTILLRSRP